MRPVICYRRYKPSPPSSHPQRSVGYLPLPTCSLFRPLFLISWTIFFTGTTTSNRLVKMMGPATLYPSFHVLFTHFSNNSFATACSPLNGITDMNAMSIFSWIVRNLISINFLPLVHLVGSVPQHFLIACSVTNFTRCRMDSQMLPSRSLR